MPSKPAAKLRFSEAMEELSGLNRWFQEDDVDLEEALEKLTRGKELITQCHARLQSIQNEFQEIKVEFESLSFHDDQDPSSE